MKKFLSIFLVISLIVVFTACNNNETESGDNEVVTGTGTVISIEGNPTTGYAWHVTNYDASLIKVEELGPEKIENSNNEQLPEEVSGETSGEISGEVSNETSGEISGEVSGETSGEGTMVGTPSVFKFRITGIKEGTSELTLEYYRDFEGADYSIDLVTYVVTVDNLLNVTAEEKVYVPDDSDLTASQDMTGLINDLVARSGVEFNMPAISKLAVANAPTFVGLSEELFNQYVEDAAVYEPMISPATSSMVVLRINDTAKSDELKQTIIDNCNPAKWICTGAEYCLTINSGNYLLLIMSTEANCNAMKTAFTEYFGADNVGEALTKEGLPNEEPDIDLPGSGIGFPIPQ